jgi:DNA-binding NarL/FixJ family response regulator
MTTGLLYDYKKQPLDIGQTVPIYSAGRKQGLSKPPKPPKSCATLSPVKRLTNKLMNDTKGKIKPPEKPVTKAINKNLNVTKQRKLRKEIPESEIIKLAAGGLSYRDIGANFNISHQTVKRIIQGQRRMAL